MCHSPLLRSDAVRHMGALYGAATFTYVNRERGNRTHIGSNFHIHDVNGIYSLF